MALGVEVLVDRVLLGARWIVRDDGGGALCGDGLAEVVGVVSGVGDDELGGKTVDQRTSLGDVTAVACGEAEPDRTS